MREALDSNHGQQTEYNDQDHPLIISAPDGALNNNTYQSFIPYIEIP